MRVLKKLEILIIQMNLHMKTYVECHQDYQEGEILNQ